VGEIAKGAVVNLAIDKIAGGAGKLTKDLGGKPLNNLANKMVGSQKQMVKNIVVNNAMSHKTATRIAKIVKSAEKAVANQVVKEAPKKAAEVAAGGAADAAQQRLVEQK
jgi:hypothetical protein